MANVTVAGASASIMHDGGVTHEYVSYGGDRVRMEDGSLRVTEKGRKNQWTLITTIIDASAASTLETAIVGAAPLTCSGDALGGSFSCSGILLEKERVVVRGVVKYRVHFALWEI
jgi:hypothetical protein